MPPAPPPIAPPPRPAGGLTLPPPTVEPATPGVGRDHRTGNGRRLLVGTALVLGVALAVGTSYWAAQSFLLRGGAGTPEAAVETLIGSIGAQDPIAAASVMHPAEVRELPGFVTDAVGKAQELKVSAGNAVPGLDVEVSDYQLDVRDEAEGVARVTVRNPRFRVAYSSASIAGTGSELAGAEQLADVDASIDQDSLGETDLFVMVVDDGDGWYVSPGMTALEYLHRYQSDDIGFDEDPDYGAFRDGGEPDSGSPEPEDVPGDVAAAVEDADTGELIDRLPSDQARVIGPYGDFLESWLAGTGFTSGRFVLDDAELETEDGNGGRRLVASAVGFSIDDDEPNELDYGPPGEPADTSDCVRLVGLTFCFAADSPMGRKLSETGLDRPSVIVRQVDDGWKLDPVATAIDWGRRALEVIDRDAVQAGLLTTSGQPAARIEPSSVIDVPFDERGFAVIELATTAGQDYVVGVAVDADSLDGDDVRSSSDVQLRVTGADGTDLGLAPFGNNNQVFRADGTTRAFVGGLENGFPAARVALVPAVATPIEVRSGLRTELRGQLDDSGVALWRVRLPQGSTSLNVEMDPTDGSNAYASTWTVGTDELLGEYVGSDAEAPAGSELIVVGSGDPGDNFAFDLVPSLRGFSDGTSTQQIIVPSGATSTERISLGNDYGTTTIDLAVQGSSWSASVESDDSYDSTGFSYSGSATDSLSISDVGDADLVLSCGSTSIRTSCIFDVTVS